MCNEDADQLNKFCLKKKNLSAAQYYSRVQTNRIFQLYSIVTIYVQKQNKAYIV
jgi:hypothetical protein